MRFRYIASVLLMFTAGLLFGRSGATTGREPTAPAPQSEKPAKDEMNRSDTMVGLTKHTDQKTVFEAREGSTWAVSNPDKLKGHEGHAVKITGTFDASTKSVHILEISNIACGPKFCERQCKGKCGNGSDCDCPKK